MDQQPHDVIPPVNMPRPESGAPFNVAENFEMNPVTENTAGRAIETAAPLASPSVQQAVSGQQVPQIPQIPTSYIPPQSVSGVYANSPAIADDADLIEKEWVEKAKEIVAQTKHDPFLQNKEVNKMKADYLKKRYNKDLKLTQD